MAFEGVSPALRAVLGFLSQHRVFTIKPWDFTGRFDNGEERVVSSHQVRRHDEEESEARWLADVEGEVMIFSHTNAEFLCSSSASSEDALSAFRKAVPLRWFLVI